MCDKLFSVLANYYSGQTLILTFFSQRGLLTKSQLRCFFIFWGKTFFLEWEQGVKTQFTARFFFYLVTVNFHSVTKKFFRFSRTLINERDKETVFCAPRDCDIRLSIVIQYWCGLILCWETSLFTVW